MKKGPPFIEGGILIPSQWQRIRRPEVNLKSLSDFFFLIFYFRTKIGKKKVCIYKYNATLKSFLVLLLCVRKKIYKGYMRPFIAKLKYIIFFFYLSVCSLFFFFFVLLQVQMAVTNAWWSQCEASEASRMHD